MNVDIGACLVAGRDYSGQAVGPRALQVRWHPTLRARVRLALHVAAREIDWRRMVREHGRLRTAAVAVRIAPSLFRLVRGLRCPRP